MTGRLATPTATLVLPANAPREAWLEARRWREDVPGHFCIGSSDVPSILDLPHVDTPAHVFHAKVNMIEKEQTEQMLWGTIFEEPIALEWIRRNKTSGTAVRRIGLVSNVDQPHQQTTLDRKVTRCPLGIEGGCALEIKRVGAYVRATRWHESLPDIVLAQNLHQLAVTGLHHMHVVAEVGGKMIQTTVFAEREQKLMAYILAEVNRFRTDHLLPRIPPPWTAEDKADKLLALDKALHPVRTGELSVQEIGEVMEYAELSARAGALKRKVEAAKVRLAKLADGAQMVTFSGRPAYSYGESTRTHVDLEALAARHPEAYADPAVVEQRTSYTLRIDQAYRVKATEEES